MSDITLSDFFSLHRLSLDASLRSAVLAECDVLSAEECPNLWIRAQDVPSAPAFATQLLVNKIHQLVMASRLSSDYSGVELWVQTQNRVLLVQKYEGGKGLAFHFDKDEHALRKTGSMSHPQYSSIVYLTGERAKPRQAPTVVCAQQYENENKTTVPEDPCSSVVIFPHMDNVLVFDGSLAHGVIHGPPSGTRMTLLINWWEQHPQDVPQLSREILQRSSMKLLHPLDLQSLKAAASSCSAVQLKYSSVVVSKFLEEGNAELVSAVCQQAGVELCGDDAVDAVLFDHAGWELVEVDVESWADEACGAAWVPKGTAEDATDEE